MMKHTFWAASCTYWAGYAYASGSILIAFVLLVAGAAIALRQAELWDKVTDAVEKVRQAASDMKPATFDLAKFDRLFGDQIRRERANPPQNPTGIL
jgi:hypothetical protein